MDISKPYITSDIKRLIKGKHKLQRLYNKKPLTYGERYRKCRNNLNSVIRQAKENYFKSQLQNNTSNSRESWRIINSLLGKHNSKELPDHFIEDNLVIDDPAAIANGFNRYFANIGTSLAENFDLDNGFLEYLTDEINDRFSFSPVTITEITHLISSAKLSAPGYDDVPMKLFKDNVLYLADIMAHVCNLNFQTGVYPKRLMVAIITCIFKSGDPHYYNNYRAISILSAFSKIIEKAATERLLEYFLDKNLLSEFQFGYKPNVSTVDALLSFVDDIYTAFDGGECAIGVFLDLSKAFDSLNRDILFRKLEYYGIRNTELLWFKSYFAERKQCVKYKNIKSNTLDTMYGVPQGSIVGPILYIIFMNDIIKCCNILKFSIYADDTCVWTKGKNVRDNARTMNDKLRKVNKWITRNGLSLNKKKCEYVFFKRKCKNVTIDELEICLDDVVLEKREYTKYLGVYVDENLSWDIHVSFVERKISKYIPIVYNIRNSLTSESLKLLYNCMIYPPLIYANIIWSSICKSKLNSLVLIQKKIVRMLAFKAKYDHTDPLFHQFNMLKIERINEYMSLIFVYKSLKKK